MEPAGDNYSHDQLVERLTTGFGALLEQVQELARRNTDLEQRLALVREEAVRIARPDGPLLQEYPSQWLQATHGGATRSKRRRSPTSSSEENAVWFLGSEGQDNAMAIVDGVSAWKALTNGTGPLWRRFNKEELDRRQDRDSTEELHQNSVFHPGHPAVDQNTTENKKCPFASMALLDQQLPGKPESSANQGPDSLPTPPHMQEHFDSNPIFKGNKDGDLSPPPSITGSVSKCPIRMLDERSPEEIAEYFEHHKHEIPRSHEICVKRYQSNAESIRQLDAKYGNLVNMIQGLGMKHQPLLPAKEDEERIAEMDAKSIKKVENWADNIKKSPEDMDLHSTLLVNASEREEREGHFDRPLKEVRVGESPSRPWGISVPGAAAVTDTIQSEAITTPRVPEAKPTPAPIEQRTTHSRSHGTGGQTEEKPQMIFTGPVFIGYPAEQAAALIEKCGWDPQGPL